MKRFFIRMWTFFVFPPKKRKELRFRLLCDYNDKYYTDGQNKYLKSPSGGFLLDYSRFNYIVLNQVLSEYKIRFDLVSQDSIVIDIGMNVGIASIYFASSSNIKYVYGFEPIRSNFNAAVHNINLNPDLVKKITPLNFGLGKTDEEIEIDVPMENGVSSVTSTSDLVENPFMKNRNDLVKERIVIKDAVKTLKEIYMKHPDEIKILKIDCEGAEFDIFQRLKEAENDILQQTSILVMEYHWRSPDEILDMLVDNSFIITQEHDSGGDIGFIQAIKYKHG